MAKFVPDIKTQRWIVISQARLYRPDEQLEKPQEHVCVFCYGNEHLTPTEIMRIGEGEKDKPGWKIRVVPNKYPITDLHEDIIHRPDHEKDLQELSLEHVELMFKLYRTRFQ